MLVDRKLGREKPHSVEGGGTVLDCHVCLVLLGDGDGVGPERPSRSCGTAGAQAAAAEVDVHFPAAAAGDSEGF